MRKRKLFIVLAIITSVFMVSVSAQCGVKTEAPVVELQIYDGPDYSESDNMCYYRVEAVSSGMPEPEIEFSAEDNVNLLGSDKVEVGVEIDDAYTLVVTASNLAGTATASITLSGECKKEEEAAEEEEAEEEAAEEEKAEEEAEEEAGEEAEEAEEEIEAVAPTITLEIYEGPTPADGICFYRVKAVVTGSPSPAVNWSKDDSGSAWGTRKAQVNLYDPDETYTLTATATNSAGTASASVNLSWGCPEPLTETDVPVISTGGGYIVWGASVSYPHDSIFAGDSITDDICRGYMGFDISGLDDVTIEEASISMSPEQVWGDPSFLGSLWIDVVDWGTDPLLMADFNITPYVAIQSFTDPDITCTDSKLKSELQKAINDGKSKFRIRIRFTTPATDSDHQWDGWDYLIDEVVLHVAYTS